MLPRQSELAAKCASETAVRSGHFPRSVDLSALMRGADISLLMVQEVHQPQLGANRRLAHFLAKPFCQKPNLGPPLLTLHLWAPLMRGERTTSTAGRWAQGRQPSGHRDFLSSVITPFRPNTKSVGPARVALSVAASSSVPLSFYIAIQARHSPGAKLIAIDHIGSAGGIEPCSPGAAQSEFA